MALRIRHFVALLLLAPVLPCGAVESLTLGIADLEGEGWRAEGVTLAHRLAEGESELRVRRLHVAGLDVPVEGLRLHCPTIDLTAPRLACRDGSLGAQGGPLGALSASANLHLDRGSATLDLELGGLRLADGDWHVAAHSGPNGWRITLQGEGAGLATLAEWLPGVAVDWRIAGRAARLNATLMGGDGERLRSVGELRLQGLGWSDATGLQAGESLTGELGWAGYRDDEGWYGQARVSLDGGQVYSDPVFLDFGAHPLQARADLELSPGRKALSIRGARLEHSGLAAGQGELQWRAGEGITAARLQPLTLLEPAFAVYLRPFLVGTAAGGIEGRGTAVVRGRIAEGAPREIAVDLSDASLSRPGLALNGINGRLIWHAGDHESPPVTRLGAADGRLYGVSLGAFDARLRLHGDGLRLEAPLRIPVLDGAVEVDTLALQGLRGATPRAQLDARIRPISLGPLSEALGGPRLTGSLSGTLPRLRYQAGEVSVGGELRLGAFGGDIRVADLLLADPFGTLPRLSADVLVRGLDLEALTTAFEFGRITGTLDGEVSGLRLLGWQPAAFRAWFHTPPDDPVAHRISQRAIEALSDIGGRGAAGALSRGFLNVFDEFRFRRLGLGCALEDDVCIMRGVAPAETGYYIVEGAGIPRVDVIGHARRVSWSTLIEQLIQATRSQGAVVE
ncbi:hypothetical protein [Arhodomonas sp. SL1]|uniref:hypothetical protein n=1 Tax=Arhodomonas sp. SL1 TaxID=3425691 RepID=UPI003F8820C8